MGLFGSLLKTAIHVVTAPVEVAKDVVTLGGALTDESEPYTVKRAKKLARDVREIEDEVDDL